MTHPGEQVVLLTTGYSESLEPTRSYPELVVIDPGAAPWRTVAMHRADEGFAEPSYWHLFASIRVERPGEFDPLVRLVAAKVIANVLAVAPDGRWVLHPSDGGMDVIAESPEAQKRLRAKPSAWLSAQPDGL